LDSYRDAAEYGPEKKDVQFKVRELVKKTQRVKAEPRVGVPA
jgi:hypothetical protein